MNFRRALLFLAVFVFSASALEAGLKTALDPRTVTVGTPASFVLVNDGAGIPEIVGGAPEIDGIIWLGDSVSSRTSSINNSVHYENARIMRFAVEHAGEFTIPALKVRAGSKTYTSDAVTFKAKNASVAMKSKNSASSARGKRSAPSAETDITKVIFSRMSVGTDEKNFYTGEEIPVDVSIYIADNVAAGVAAYPEITPGKNTNIVFRDYQHINREDPRFDLPFRAEETIGGINFGKVVFRTSIRSLSPGEIMLSSATDISVRTSEPQRRSSTGDPFFDGFFDSPFGGARTMRYVAKSSLPGIKIVRLPAQTNANAEFIGLVGGWTVSPSLQKKSAKVGEAVTLRIKINGNGSLEMLSAPELAFDGFRVYAPEVEKNESSGQAVIRYVLIPMTPGEKKISLELATFDPVSGKYSDTAFSAALNVEKASAVFDESSPRVIDSAAAQASPEVPGENSRKAPGGVLYLKKPPFDSVLLPLRRNSILPCIALVFSGMLFFIVCELVYARRRSRENDPGIIRRENASARRKTLFSAIRSADGDRLPDLSGDITSFVNDALDLPQGTSLSEAAEIIRKKDPALADALSTLGGDSWSPTGAKLEEKDRKALLRGLPKLLSLLLLFAVPFNAFSAEKTSAITSPEQAMTAYDEGDFAGALKYYMSLESRTSPSSSVLYNIGDCLYQEGKYASALAYYERALRLSPRDTDILENLNLTNRKLFLKEKYKIESPADVPVYLRDMFRPDEWFVWISFGIALMFCGLGLRRFAPGRVWISILAAGAVLAAVPGAFALSQICGRSAEAIVVERGTPVHSLPSDSASKVDMNLAPGETVHIEERRLDWVRIRSGAMEGWVREKDIAEL